MYVGIDRFKITRTSKFTYIRQFINRGNQLSRSIDDQGSLSPSLKSNLLIHVTVRKSAVHKTLRFLGNGRASHEIRPIRARGVLVKCKSDVLAAQSPKVHHHSRTQVLDVVPPARRQIEHFPCFEVNHNRLHLVQFGLVLPTHLWVIRVLDRCPAETLIRTLYVGDTIAWRQNQVSNDTKMVSWLARESQDEKCCASIPIIHSRL
jgi:hypothetical protein